MIHDDLECFETSQLWSFNVFKVKHILKQPAWKPWQGQYGFSIFGARDSRDPPGAILIGVAVGPIRFPTQAEHGDHEPRPFWGCPCDTPWCQMNKKSWCNFGQSKKTEQRTNKYGLQPFWFAKVDPASTDFTGFYNIYVLLVFFLGVATAIYHYYVVGKLV